MKHLTIATVIEKNKIASDVAFVVAIEVDVREPITGAFVETLYFVKNTENITFNGNEYIAADFTLEISEETGSIPSVQIAIKDFTQAVQTKMQEYGGGVGFDVKVLVINSARLDAPPEMKEYFTILAASAEDYIVSWEIGAENPLTIRYPKRRQFKDRCPWQYKGERCGYTGDMPSCDLTLQGENGCTAHGNSANYGGFPGIVRQ